MAVDRERLSDRLAAVERRLTDADPEEGGLADVAAVEGRLSELETRADDLDARLGEVESGLQALRGYVGGVDAVDESVERRADAALAKAEELESLLVDEPGLRVERVSTDPDRADGGRNGMAAADDGPDDPVGGRTARRGNGADVPPATPPESARSADSGAADGSPGGTDAGPDTDGRRLVDRLRDAL